MDPLAGPDTNGIVVPRVVKRPALSPAYKATTVDVFSNHYNFTLGQNGKIYQWDVKFEPELEKDSREVKNDIFGANRRDIIKKVGLFIRTGDIVFTFKKSNLQETTVIFSNHSKYKLVLKYIGKELYFDGLDAPDESRFQIFKVINSGIKQIMKHLGYTEFGRSRKFYDLAKKQELNQGDFILDVKSGYFTSIDLYQKNKAKLMIDCSSRIIRVYSMWEEYLFFKDQKGLTEREIEDEYIIGRNFLASYGNNRVYRIDGIVHKMTPLSEFPDRAKAATFKEYFKKQYGTKINDDNQFLVYSIRLDKKMVNGKLEEKEERVYLVPELLKPTGLTDELRKDKNAMQDIAKFTKLYPETRNQRQENLIKNFNSLTDKDGNDLGLRVDPKSNKIKGKLLDFPQIMLQRPMIPDRGNFIIKSQIYDQNASLRNWMIVFNSRDEELAFQFAHKLNECSKSLGIKVDKPKMQGISIAKDAKSIRDDEITKAIEKNAGIGMVLVFLPKQNADRVYKKVKVYCNQVAGIPSQFFTNWSFKFTKNIENLSVASKVLMQMCAKMKAKIWKVQTPVDVNVNGHQVMIVGADVFHKSMHESVTSVVSSYDKDFCSYYSQTSVQKRKGDDTLYDIAEKVKLAARRYVKENKHPPNIIVVYRDGVGQGQIESVREKELKSLIKGLQQEFNGKAVKLAYIIVTKRLSDRFFVSLQGQLDNPQGGLIVDSDVVKEDQFDYFMVAQAVSRNQGTATPTNYNVIYNDTDLKAETFYEMTYFQCFSYYNWSGPLKVPAVIMMANKQALVVGSTHSKDNRDTVESLKDGPFYL
jgi:aubergine-like protein